MIGVHKWKLLEDCSLKRARRRKKITQHVIPSEVPLEFFKRSRSKVSKLMCHHVKNVNGSYKDNRGVIFSFCQFLRLRQMADSTHWRITFNQIDFGNRLKRSFGWRPIPMVTNEEHRAPENSFSKILALGHGFVGKEIRRNKGTASMGKWKKGIPHILASPIVFWI